MATGSTIAIIPARGGSKGVPRKNLRRVGGVPLVVRAIHSAQQAERVDRVIVSTDDIEIADISRAAGAEVVDRPAALSGDLASSETALLHAIDEVERAGATVQTVVFLQATSPFIASSGIDDALALIAEGGYDVAFSAFETFGFLWARDGGGTADAINHSAAARPRRQDREPHYMETGAFYAMDAAGFRAAGHRFFGRVGIVEVPEASAIEIDDAAQLAIAGALASLVDDVPSIHVDAVVTDFDGVHTDDTATVDAVGGESVRVSRSDGMGVSLLRRTGIPFLILSSETNPVVRARAQKLQVPVIHGVGDKAEALRDWAAAEGVALERIAYLGNDVNDLPAMELVGWPVAVADARAQVRAASRLILEHRGGEGAVRELLDLVIASHDATPAEASSPRR